MFERLHHRRIAQVLQSLNADLMVQHRSLFGGGTAIALSHGEYRESVDIDFICSSVEGYRNLRGLVNSSGIEALLSHPVEVAREPRIDQYGIRCAWRVEGIPIKFEIVFEGRVELSPPLEAEKICGVWTLAPEDRIATKLMANSDRWADDSVMSRDLIDLSILCGDGTIAPAGVKKAMHAYGESILRDFEKARKHLLNRKGRLETCVKKMGMSMPVEDLRMKIQALSIQSPVSGPEL